MTYPGGQSHGNSVVWDLKSRAGRRLKVREGGGFLPGVHQRPGPAQHIPL